MDPTHRQRELTPLLNYVVDAHDGAILTYYSAYPMLDVPSLLQGSEYRWTTTAVLWDVRLPVGSSSRTPRVT